MKCEFCSWENGPNFKDGNPCGKCGLWKGHKYETTTVSNTTIDELARAVEIFEWLKSHGASGHDWRYQCRLAMAWRAAFEWSQDFAGREESGATVPSDLLREEARGCELIERLKK